jgi:hypothetical protein
LGRPSPVPPSGTSASSHPSAHLKGLPPRTGCNRVLLC